MAVMPRNPNPNLGFRGNPNGQAGKKLIDYGVYAAPLQRALSGFGYQSDVMLYGNDAQLKGYLNRGRPIVAWITYALRPAVPRLAEANGMQFILVPSEHAVLLVGYDAGTVLANDPWTQQLVRYTWKAFNRSWGLFGDMALAMQPCPTPQSVGGVTVKATSAGSVTWSWKPAWGAARYRLMLTTGGTNRVVLHSGDQPTTRFTDDALKPGRSYVLTIASVAPCGLVSAGTTVWYVAPEAPPVTATPTATPAEATVTPATPVTTRSAGAPPATATAIVGTSPTAGAPRPSPTAGR